MRIAIVLLAVLCSGCMYVGTDIGVGYYHANEPEYGGMEVYMTHSFAPCEYEYVEIEDVPEIPKKKKRNRK